jgi:hypothetical protein
MLGQAVPPRLEMSEDVREALIDDLEAGQPDLDSVLPRRNGILKGMTPSAYCH